MTRINITGYNNRLRQQGIRGRRLELHSAPICIIGRINRLLTNNLCGL